MAWRAGWASLASAGSTERSPITPRWHSMKRTAVREGSVMGRAGSRRGRRLRRRLRDDSRHLELHHLVGIAADSGQDFVAVLVELGRALGWCRLAGVLHGGRHQLERGAVARGRLAEVAVRLDLGIGRELQTVLREGPL